MDVLPRGGQVELRRMYGETGDRDSACPCGEPGLTSTSVEHEADSDPICRSPWLGRAPNRYPIQWVL